LGYKKKLIDMTKEDILCYLDNCRKTENEDPLHKWIGSYNTRLVILSRFFKWLHYPDVEDPKRRNELSALEKKPGCIMDIRRLKRKEISCYKPSDLWIQEDDIIFLKWVTNKRCYHTMARDLSARPHEILNLKIKDIVVKTVEGGKQYAEVLVNGKTGSTHIPLIQSTPYIKEWYLTTQTVTIQTHLCLWVSVEVQWGSSLALTACTESIKTIKKTSFQSY
jgi:integrase